MKKCVRLAALCLLLLGVAAAESKETPNFSGYWKLDTEKSDFGGITAPTFAGYTIRHVGAKLAFDYTQESQTTRIEITTDGQERMTDSNPEFEVWTRAFWEGSVLMFEARQRPRPAHENPNVKWTSRWKLSPDGKVLTIERQITAPQGQLNQVLVFNKTTPENSKEDKSEGDKS
jgi:hypothetical protein